MKTLARQPAPYSQDPTTLWRQVRVDTYRGSGPGGQHRNRRDSAVRLTHIPSGVVVTADDSRSQLRNRKIAMTRLIERLAARNRRPKRRRPTRISRTAKERRVAEKRRHGERKRLRSQ